MSLTFDVIFLGNFASIDPTEGNTDAENALVLEGEIVGGPGAPLYNSVRTFSPGSIDFSAGGNTSAYDQDNNVSSETFSIDGGSDQTFDATASYSITLTYTDGSTAAITGVVFQDTDGNTYLAPQISNNANQAALEAKAIESLSIDTLLASSYSGMSSFRDPVEFRVPDGAVDGEDTGEVMASGYNDGDGAINNGGDQITSGDDSIAGNGGDDTIYVGTGNDSVTGGTGADIIQGNAGNDTIDGGDQNDVIYGDTAPATFVVQGFEYNINFTTPDVAQLGEFISLEVDITGDPVDIVFLDDDGVLSNDTNSEQFASNDATQFVLVNGVQHAANIEATVFFDGDDGNTYEMAVVQVDLDNDGTANAATSEQGYFLVPIGAVPPSGVNLVYTFGDFDSAQNYGDLFGAGGDGDDVLDGGEGDDAIYGGGGNDTIDGGVNNDTLFGGDGDDSVDGGIGWDLIFGGDGADVLSGGGSFGNDDTVYGGTGSDTIDGGPGASDDSLFGDGGNDQISGGGGFDTIEGGAGDDTIDGGNEDDLIYGDRSEIFADGNRLSNGDFNGGLTSWTVNNVSGLPPAVFADGRVSFNRSDETEYGDSIQQSFDANVGQEYTVSLDLFETGSGSGSHTFRVDILDQFGNVIETVTQTVTDGATLPVSFTFTPTTSTNTVVITNTTSTNTVASDGQIDNVVIEATGPLPADGNDSLSGGAGTDVIDGGAGDDRLDGGTGNDTVIGGLGSDTILLNNGYAGDSITGGEDAGNSDIDVIDASGMTADGVGIFLSGNEDGSITSSQGTAHFVEIEGFVLTDQDDTFQGGNSTESLDLDGRGGDDSLVGGTGDDTFTGGAGNDTLRGGFGGNDSLSGGVGDDVLFESTFTSTLDGGEGSDRFEVGLGTSTVSGGDTGSNVDTLSAVASDDAFSVSFDGTGFGTYDDLTDGDGGTFTGIEAVEGSSGADSIDGSLDSGGLQLSGNAGEDTIFGGAGNDTIDGGDDADTLVGGGGTDSITGGAGDDLIVGGNNGGAFATAGDIDPNSADTLDGGAGNDTIYGNIGSDVVVGGAGDDSLFGEWGDDSITGGEGNDFIAGGSGNDTFFYNPGDGLDTISDFNTGNTGTLNDGDATNNDSIDLSGYYDHISELYADQADDGVLNQSNTTDSRGNAVDYSDNTQFDTNGTPNDEGIFFAGASADESSFTVENTGVVCFVAGTLILTEMGEVPVERLRVDDRIVTYDNGLQPLAMLASRRLGADELARNSNLKPIEIKPGALGFEQRLVVSPQHMMLIKHDGDERLVRARQLARLKGGAVRVMRGCRGVTYYHLIFDAHQIVFANKRPAESFFPGQRALAALDADARHEFLSLFPDLGKVHFTARGPKGWETARDGIRSCVLPTAIENLNSPPLHSVHVNC